MCTVNDLVNKANDTCIKALYIHHMCHDFDGNTYDEHNRIWDDSLSNIKSSPYIRGYHDVIGINKIILNDKVFVQQPKIKNVIFNDPATIVYWKDRTKTVVKCDGEKYDPEKGLTMAITKKMLGNKGNYYEVIKKWVGEDKFFPEGKKSKKKDKKRASNKKTSKK